MEKFLVIAGISGTGKTVLRDKLKTLYPDMFYICPQVTTRDLRVNESIYNYIFLEDKTVYELIEPMLVGKTEINGKYYGSLYSKQENRIGIIILNESGLMDFLKFKQSSESVSSVIVGLDKDINDLTVSREGRDVSYLESEKRVLSLCDYVLNLSNGKWADPKVIKNLCDNAFTNSENPICKWCNNDITINKEKNKCEKCGK